ncbi:tyrosine-type recombinase/integrase [Bacillus cereus]|uniref:tyrosine-type recombinase/integrase n=1 Tax=Bacillus cereus TaxID=1396 RepID=UPI000BEC03B5|nr:site-specific integrase [Bacillus cereus]PEF66699.1 hypothetical protein CON35_11985 [Bacillus cereus]
MFTIKIVEKMSYGVYKISINGHEFLIRGHQISKISQLENWLQNMQQILIKKDLKRTKSYLKHVSPFHFNCMVTLFPYELKKYVFHICDYFLQNKIKISAARLVRYIITNDLDTCRLQLSVPTDIVSVFTPMIEEYKKELTCKFITACKQNDTITIWTISSMFTKTQLIKIVKLNNETCLHFKHYVEFCSEHLIKEYGLVSPNTLANYSFYGELSHQNGNSFTSVLPFFKSIGQKAHDTLRDSPNSYTFEDDTWLLTSQNLTGVILHRFEFDSYPPLIKREVKTYLNYLMENTSKTNKTIYTIHLQLKKIIKELGKLPYDDITSLLKINYLHALHLINHLQQIVTPNATNKYSYNTIRLLVTKLKLIIDFLIDHSKTDLDNPFRKYTFKNANSGSTKTTYIPEAIIKQLEDKLHNAPKSVQNAWTILMNTGMRFSDLKLLEEDCIEFNKKINMYTLRYIIPKSKHQRMKQGLSKYHTIPVNQAVVTAIKNQKEITEDLRLTANTKHIFITTNNFAVVLTRGSNLSLSINRLCKKYEIKNEDGSIFHFSTHMCRKTLVMDLLTQGMSIEQTADFIGHLEPQTTEKYYRDVDHKMIAEMDNKMWKELFEYSLPSDIQETYSTKEQDSLFQEFKLGTRETPEGHGLCAKHVSFGPCKKKKCVGCRMLITGPEKLPKWQKLYTEQKEYILSMENQYAQAGMKDFKNHRLYQQEIRLLTLYEDTIKKINMFLNRSEHNIE